jgi:hypothetical protein
MVSPAEVNLTVSPMSLLLSRFNFHVPANGVSAANAKLAAPSTTVREIAFRNNFIGALLAWILRSREHYLPRV